MHVASSGRPSAEPQGSVQPRRLRWPRGFRVVTKPYQLTTWNGDYKSHGRFATFPEALAAFVACDDYTKQVVNADRAECGRDGLTDEERDELAAITYAEERAAS